MCVQCVIYTPRGGNGVLAQFECPYIYIVVRLRQYLCVVCTHILRICPSRLQWYREALVVGGGGEHTEKSKRLSEEYIYSYVYEYYEYYVRVCERDRRVRSGGSCVYTNCTHASHVYTERLLPSAICLSGLVA